MANHVEAMAEISEVLFPPASWTFGAAGKLWQLACSSREGGLVTR
jgi:hypothetical protein